MTELWTLILDFTTGSLEYYQQLDLLYARLSAPYLPFGSPELAPLLQAEMAALPGVRHMVRRCLRRAQQLLRI